jgi:hypothetical protein
VECDILDYNLVYLNRFIHTRLPRLKVQKNNIQIPNSTSQRLMLELLYGVARISLGVGEDGEFGILQIIKLLSETSIARRRF